MDSDEWGEGGGVGTDERGGCAAGPLSSMCVLVVCVRARRLCARLSSVCALVVCVRAHRLCAHSLSGEGGGMGNDGGGAAGPSLSVGARRPWVGGRGWLCALAGRPWATCSSLWLAIVSGGHWVVVLFMGAGRRLWVLSVVRGGWVVACGGWAIVLGAGLLTVGAVARSLWAGLLCVGAGLLIVAGGARLHGRGVGGCWFVVRGRGGDVSSAVWSS